MIKNKSAKKFTLTYSVVTEASAEQGDHARHGFVTRNLTIPDRTYLPDNPAHFRLREAVEFLKDRESSGPVEADSYPLSLQCPPRWFNYGGSMDFNTEESVTVSLHLPRTVTASSAIRVARLLDCYGLRN